VSKPPSSCDARDLAERLTIHSKRGMVQAIRQAVEGGKGGEGRQEMREYGAPSHVVYCSVWALDRSIRFSRQVKGGRLALPALRAFYTAPSLSPLSN
jgi:hypothetical protein